MGHRSLLPSAALIMWLIVAPFSAAAKSEKSDAAHIAKLVAQLGNDDFNEREKAYAALDALGQPALDALRQAASSTDEEVRKRAGTLVGRIERRLKSAVALRAKRVHLVYKDTALEDAVEDFEKQSGNDIALYDPKHKLTDRTITLDTGDAPFWQAFDQFCDKAGLKETEARNLAPIPPSGINVRLALASDYLILIDGKAASPPTDAASAVRILAKPDRLAVGQKDEIPLALQLSLEPRLHWRTVKQVAITKAVDDQNQVLRQIANPPAVPPPVFGVYGFTPNWWINRPEWATPEYNTGALIHQEASIRLKKGERISKSLRELRGTISAMIFAAPAPIITAPDILKAVGKTFEGDGNSFFKLVEVSKNDKGRVTLRVEVQEPTDALAVRDLIPRGGRVVLRPVPTAFLPKAGIVPPGGIDFVKDAVLLTADGPWPSIAGLKLLDAKDKVIRVTFLQSLYSHGPPVYTFSFQAEKGREKLKMIYSVRKLVRVEIPFRLKDVPLP